MDKIPQEVRKRIDANRGDSLILKEIAASLTNTVLFDEIVLELLRDVANSDTTQGLWYKVLREENLWRMSKASK